MYDFEDDEDLTNTENNAGEEVLEELDDQSQDSGDEFNTAEVMNQAMKRIEEANLFTLLINGSVFAAGSARAEILAAVDYKLKQFAIKELELLLGIRKEEEVVQVQQTAAQFSEEEAAVLKMLIGKVMKKEGVTTTTPAAPQLQEVKPAISQIKAPTPQVNQIQAPATAQPKVANPAAAPKQQPTGKKQPGKRKTVSKGFAKPNKSTKVKPMPTADQMLQQGMLRTPDVNVTAEAGVSGKAAKSGAVSVGALISQIAGGNLVHVDNSNPADAALGGDGAGDTNERF